jgi:hypothetical protein
MAEKRSLLRIRDDGGSDYVTICALSGEGSRVERMPTSQSRDVGHPASKFFPFFSGVVEFVFCSGFREKRGAERGFLMVKSWWNAGKRWSENYLKSATKNTPLF